MLILTRPQAQAQSWLPALQAQGQAAFALPLLGIEALAEPQALVQAWAQLADQALAMFVSANAVEHFFAQRQGRAWPAHTLAGSTGAGTTAALLAAGVPAAAIVAPGAGQASDSEALWVQLQTRAWSQARVLIVRGEEGRDWLSDRLHAAGAEVQAVAAYRRTPPVWGAAERQLLAQALAQPSAFVWHFSSSEGLGHLNALVAAAGLSSPPEGPRVAEAGRARWRESRALATHERIRSSALALGFGQVQTLPPGLAALAGHPFLESTG